MPAPLVLFGLGAIAKGAAVVFTAGSAAGAAAATWALKKLGTQSPHRDQNKSA